MADTILIVDDDPGAAEAFGPMLRAHGYHVRVAGDAESGLRELERSRPAAILVDLHLPTVDGVEFLTRLRASSRHARIPVAVVTGDYLVGDHVMERLQALGAQLFLKPLWEDDLNRIVRDLIRTGSTPAWS